MTGEIIKNYITNKLHDDAEYISGCLTWILSFVSLNIHLSEYSSPIIIKLLSGMISLIFTGIAVILTHFLKQYLDNKYPKKRQMKTN